MTYEDAYRLLPDTLKNDLDMEALDELIDKIAANSKYTNAEVCTFLFKLIHWMCGTGVGTGLGGY